LKAFTYQGEEVQLTLEGLFKFDESEYATAQKAKDAIDRKQKAKAREAKRPLSLAVVNEEGEPRVITGVHSSNYNYLAKPQLDRYRRSDRSIYVDAPMVREAIAKKVLLQGEIKKLDAVLSQFKIDSIGYQERKHSIEKLYDQLEKSHAEMLAAALATTLEGELAGK
jgi:hypothetical protein